MSAEILRDYEQGAANAARRIYRIKQDEADAAAIPSSLKALAAANAFNGEEGALIAHEDGVLLGVGAGRDPLIAAVAASKLPAGDYIFDPDGHDARPELACLGWLIGGYRFDRYKSQEKPAARLVAPAGVDASAIRRAAAAAALVRDLVNTPACDMTPDALESEARRVAEQYGTEISSIVGDDLLAENFPMVHAVGRAAAAPPRLIDLRWGPEAAPKVTLVGKGVTFDSGGLNIKGAAGMALMKKDMGGAAHALGLARMIMGAGLKVRLRVLIPAVENALSGDAFRPGDILQSRKGLTVEIGNTDAEGRLILADALALAGEDNPALTISLATLTGAARIALGPELAPYYCDDHGLAAALEDASARTADPVWRMPLWRNYESMLSSSIADVNHISAGPFAGSITAALFLKKFAPEAGPWMHFDIYAWRPKAAPGRPVGGEAQAIRALFDVLSARYGG